MMKPLILIVDDEESIRLGFEMILSEDYDVVVSSGYNDAVEKISEKKPDLIISDIILGGKTGIDLLKKVKEIGLHSPVIMITGEPGLETSTEAVRLGAFDYISKPIKKDALLRIAHNAVRHKKLLDNKFALERENLRVRQNMEAIFQSIEEGVISIDSKMNILEVNSSMEKICSLSAKEITGKNIHEIKTTCSRSCLKLLPRILKEGKNVKDIRCECMKNESPRQMVLATGTPLKFMESGRDGAILIVRNITQLLKLEDRLKERDGFDRVIGRNIEMKKLYSLLEDISDIDSTILITGETGTGKERFADAIHSNSTRKSGPFVKVNCSALSENLLESELFGHVKGAFTGAVKDKKGRFEAANGGTLFLDELGDISPLIQLKLLRVLQEREFERVGDSRTIKVDVRIIAATNCDLKEKVKKGEFREDLFYRINVINMKIPPLRERREDIPLFADHFMKIFNKRFKKKIRAYSSEVMNTFMGYEWPGNIRELEHAIEHGFILCREDTVLFEHLPLEIKNQYKGSTKDSSGKKSITKKDILLALEKSRWNKSKAAKMLGIARRTIYRKIEEFNIKDS